MGTKHRATPRRNGKKSAKLPERPFVGLGLSLLRSSAWQTRSIHCVRLIDRLMLEHLETGGDMNGRLKVPYSQLVDFGINRRFVPKAIKEAEERGLLRVARGGWKSTILREDSLYRLTFFHTMESEEGGRFTVAVAPTDDWKGYVQKAKARAITTKKLAAE